MKTNYDDQIGHPAGYALLGGMVADHTSYGLPREQRDILAYAGFADRQYAKTELFFAIHPESDYMRDLPEIAQDDLGNVILDIIEHMVKNEADTVRFLNVRSNKA
jgi:hypothetical protein